MFALIHLFAFVYITVCQQQLGLRVFTTDFHVGLLDVSTGEVQSIYELEMPNTTCAWHLGDGTRGQSSDVFFTNHTYFFLAQEKCNAGSLGRTALVATIGPFPSSPPSTSPVAMLDINFNINELNIAWDHTCNLVVISPAEQDEGSFKVNQVSEYDGAQRFQPTYELRTGWKKVPGLGALDFGNFQTSRSLDQEWNCGPSCTFYTVEEQEGVTPRNIVGRSYRTGVISFTIPDSVQAQSLSWYPFTEFTVYRLNQFLGIGICCTSHDWCHPDCQNFQDGNLVLISFTPKSGFSVLADIGEVDQDTTRLGVEFSPAPFSRSQKQAYVLHNNSVISFDLIEDANGLVVKATKVHQSPPLTFGPLSMWANSGSF